MGSSGLAAAARPWAMLAGASYAGALAAAASARRAPAAAASCRPRFGFQSPFSREAETMNQDALPLDWPPARIAERRRAFLSPALASFTAYESAPVWRCGSGAYLWDAAGRRH